MINYKYWTQEEEDLLYKSRILRKPELIKLFPNRTWNSIASKFNKLNICRKIISIQDKLYRFIDTNKMGMWKFNQRGDDCWVWNGAKTKDGYGIIGLRRKGKLAHRVSWEVHLGIIPNGMEVAHTCDNPPCINPSHLFLATHKDNMQDSIRKNRFVYPKPHHGIEHYAAKLTDEVVMEIRKDKRFQKVIASEYGVSQTLISMIKLRKIWNHI